MFWSSKERVYNNHRRNDYLARYIEITESGYSRAVNTCVAVNSESGLKRKKWVKTKAMTSLQRTPVMTRRLKSNEKDEG